MRPFSQCSLSILLQISSLFPLFILIPDLDGQNLDESVTAARTDTPISIDGRLNELVWQRPGRSGLIQRQPNEGAPSSEKTEVWVAYDDDALYVAARLYDQSPDSITGRLVRRDADFESDAFFISIDSNHDRLTAYFFGTNPSGCIQDGIIFDDTKTDNSWDAVWDVAVETDSEGWNAEFRIPFSQIRFSKEDRYTWGIEVSRTIHRKNEEAYFLYYPRNDQVRVSRWIELRGIEGIEPPPRVEISPYVAATGKFLQSPPVDAFNSGRKDPFVFGRDYFGRAGADAKIGLSGNFTLDASINPDFAQVEVDPAVVNLSAYETYYSEKRSFFVGGSNILSFGRGGAADFWDFNWSDPAFFYSRRIGRAPQGSVTHPGFTDVPDRTTILGAAKVSGKTEDGWSLAALTALTNREYGRIDSAGVRIEEEIEPYTFYGIVRAQKNFEESRQAIGIIATLVERDTRETQSIEFLNKRAVSVGIDGWTFLDSEKNWVLTGWAGMTNVSGSQSRMLSLQQSPQHYFQKPDQDHLSVDSSATSLTGWAGRIWLNKDKGNWRLNAAAGFINPSFEANDLGFHTYTDIINTHVWIGYDWYDPDPVFRTKSVGVAALEEFNFGGLKTGETFFLNGYLELLSYWSSSIFLGYNTSFFDDRRTRGGPLMRSMPSKFIFLSFNSDSRENFFGSLSVDADRGNTGGWDYGASLTLTWRISRALNLSFGPSYSRNHSTAYYVEAIPDSLAIATFGTRYVFAALDQQSLSATMRLNWTFSPKLSFQLYSQPFLSAGHYSDFKSLAAPGTFTFIPSTTTLTPDFNFKSLRVNAVLRWEYLPGSTLYLVWTNEKTHYEQNYGIFRTGRDFSEMIRARPDNVFSLKITYWWSP